MPSRGEKPRAFPVVVVRSAPESLPASASLLAGESRSTSWPSPRPWPPRVPECLSPRLLGLAEGLRVAEAFGTGDDVAGFLAGSNFRKILRKSRAIDVRPLSATVAKHFLHHPRNRHPLRRGESLPPRWSRTGLTWMAYKRLIGGGGFSSLEISANPFTRLARSLHLAAP
ncbi:MAG: hypothetical protein H7839_21355 [Magnetococcus sp. YQC-5]